MEEGDHKYDREQRKKRDKCKKNSSAEGEGAGLGDGVGGANEHNEGMKVCNITKESQLIRASFSEGRTPAADIITHRTHTL